MSDGPSKNVVFYDPHPGVGGAAVPLPIPVRDFIKNFDGRELPLEEVVDSLTLLASSYNGTIEVVEQYNYLGLRIDGREGETHYYRLLRYKATSG